MVASSSSASSPEVRVRTAGFARTSAGVPSAITARSRARRSGRRSTSRARRRARRAGRPCAGRRRGGGSATRARWLSVSSRPAAGSSSMMTDGPEATARAMPTRRRRPYGSSSGAGARCGSSANSWIARDRGRRQACVPGPDEVGEPRHGRGGVGAGADVVLDADVLEQLERLERAAQAATRPACVGDQPLIGASSSVNCACRGPHEAGDRVDDRGLAGAVGADEPDDLARAAPSKLTSSTAVTPPKRTVRSVDRQRRRRHRLGGSGFGQEPVAGARSTSRSLRQQRSSACVTYLGDAVLVDDDDHQQDHAADERRPTRRAPSTSSMIRVPRPPMAFGAENTAPMTKPRPPITAQPTLKIDCERAELLVGDDRPTGSRGASPPSPAIAGGDAERVELHAEHADAERSGGPLVRAHRDETPAGPRPAQVGDDQSRRARTRRGTRRAQRWGWLTASTSIAEELAPCRRVCRRRSPRRSSRPWRTRPPGS